MAAEPGPPIGALLKASEAGNADARDALFAALYHELHRLAQIHLSRSAGPITLSATTLLHEAYLDISRREHAGFAERTSFLAYASRAMRGLVLDYVRSKRALKRGGDLTFLSLEEALEPAAASDSAEELEELDAALKQLEEIDPSLARLVDLKFFCGFTFAEVAALRGVSERTVQRDWLKARLMLHHWLSEQV